MIEYYRMYAAIEKYEEKKILCHFLFIKIMFISDANCKNTHKNFTQFKGTLVCQLIEQVSVWINVK